MARDEGGQKRIIIKEWCAGRGARVVKVPIDKLVEVEPPTAANGAATSTAASLSDELYALFPGYGSRRA
jgi:hypothetical protein